MSVGAINVYSATGMFVSGAFSGSDGVFQTGGLPPGTYFVRVLGSAGFGSQLYNAVGCAGCDPTLGTPVVVTAGVVTANINFALVGSGSISGTVTSETNGSPLQNVVVEAVGANGGVVNSTTTDASGTYTISGLGGGTSYYVRTGTVFASHFVPEIYPGLPCGGCVIPFAGAAPVAVTAGATTSNINFALGVGGMIQGHVTSGGSPVSVTVEVFSSSNALMWQGFSSPYTTLPLPPGTYFVRTSGGSSRINELYNDIPCLGPDCIPITGTPVTVTAGNTTFSVNFDLASGGRISGSVKSSGGVGLSNAIVELFSSTGRLLGSASTGSGSSYSLPAVPDGTYFLRASAGSSGFADELYDNVLCVPVCGDVTTGTPVVVTGGANQTGKNFLLDVTAGALSGTVRDANTLAPLASGVAVFSADGTLVKTATANANGLFAILGLPAGTYYARTTNTFGYRDKIFNNATFCDPSCHVTDGSAITVTAGSETTGVNFDLVAGLELLQNPGFSNGLTNWSVFATPDNSYLVGQLLLGAFRYYRANPPPGTSNSAVILQNTSSAVAPGDPVLVQFDLANTSDVRKRISVLVHASDFSDLAVCTFWVPPNFGPRRYGMLTHPTQAWTNATVSLYAATEGSQGGFYQVDNVTMQTLGNVDVEQTQCIDPATPAAAGGPAGPELLVNGDFSSGDTTGWQTVFQITSQVAAGVFEFIRPSPNSDPAGVILQSTGAIAAAGDRFTAHFDLGNSSGVRKRVTVLLHDLDFSDLSACTFWIEPGQPLSPYTMQAYATKAWSNATLSIYAATAGNETWTRLDNVSLKKTPSASITGTGCFEPGSNQPLAAIGGGSTNAVAVSGGSVSAGASSSAGAVADGPVLSLEAATGRVGTPWKMVDLTQTDAGMLSFDSRFSEDGPRARVEISVDGEPWQTLAHVPVSDDWLNLSIDLSAFAGHVVRMRFVLDAGAVEATDPKRWQIRNAVLILR